jgi:formate dehydrogenase iron-sulfur subunit
VKQACNRVNALPPPERSFEDLTVLDKNGGRTSGPTRWSIAITRAMIDGRDQLIPTFVKLQCMHCQDPACASACIVGALTKKENGAVHYDVTKCIGCRYCMVACPFEIPAYEYHDPITPRVMKCTFCYERVMSAGRSCPDVRRFARWKPSPSANERFAGDCPAADQKKSRPLYRSYLRRKEVGGTSWMYLSGVPFEKLGFNTLPENPCPGWPKPFSTPCSAYLWSPIVLFGMLGGVMWSFKDKGDRAGNGKEGGDQ